MTVEWRPSEQRKRKTKTEETGRDGRTEGMAGRGEGELQRQDIMEEWRAREKAKEGTTGTINGIFNARNSKGNSGNLQMPNISVKRN